MHQVRLEPISMAVVVCHGDDVMFSLPTNLDLD